jgi:hypothetical protein
VGPGRGKIEMICSMLRQAGLPEERINLDGWKPGPRESFIVAAPVDGLSLRSTRHVGEVVFANVNPVTMNLTGDRPTNT